MEDPTVTVFGQFSTIPQNNREKHLEERRRDAIVIVSIELLSAVVGFAVALRAYLITANIKAGAFWSHIALVLACLFLLIGICLHYQGKTWMVVGMVTNVIGILMAFIGTLVDGAQAGHLAQTNFDDCDYSLYTSQVPCYNSGPAENYNCDMSVYENSCYCCYIYRENHCDTSGFSLSTQPNIFRGVDSCDQVEEEYQILLWASMSFNLLQFVVATVAVSLVGRYKSLVSQCIHPSTVNQMVVSPSMIGGSLTGGPVVIFNQQTVGYYPHVANPPAYSEAVGIGPPPAQPGELPPVSNPVNTGVTYPKPQSTRRESTVSTGLGTREPPPPFHSEYSLPPPYSP